MDTKELVGPIARDILDSAGEAERARRLPDGLMAKLRQRGLFSIYTPREFGGMGLPLADGLRIVEEVSRYDGSTGWTVALGFGNDLFLSALPAATVRRLLPGGSALISGAPGPGVRAVPVEGGYRLTGQWAFNSGASNADSMGVAAMVFDGESPRMGAAGPEMVFAILRPADVEVVDTWKVTGLRATSSHDLRVNDVFVPEEMTGGFGLPGGPKPLRPSVATRFPFFCLLGLVQSPPVALGVARHALEEFRALAAAKERPFAGRLSEQALAHAGLARAEALLRSGRSYWYETVRCAWDRVASGGELSLEERANLKLASLTAVENAVAAVDQVHRLAGSSAIFECEVLERCWRDVHTAAQHLQVQDARWENAGRILFGLEPNNPFI